MAASKLANVLFVVNPISGDIEKGTVNEAIEAFCLLNQINFVFFETTGQNDLEKLKAILKTESYQAIFAVGGDGTSHLVGSALIHSSTPMGIIPMGSGNGLSKDLGIPQELDDALGILLHYQVKAIDTLSVNNVICVHLTDLGFNALVVKRFSEGEKRGATSYAFVAMQEYLSYEPKLYTIETDNGTFKGPAFMVTITNANAFGSNATINPSGIIDDGKFEICIIEPFPKTSGLQILYRLYNDSIEASDYSRLISCRQAEIYNPEQDVSQVDGEPKELGEKITIKLLPKSLLLLIPKQMQVPEKE
jgi:diacylglycerol kinase family enzyme